MRSLDLDLIPLVLAQVPTSSSLDGSSVFSLYFLLDPLKPLYFGETSLDALDKSGNVPQLNINCFGDQIAYLVQTRKNNNKI